MCQADYLNVAYQLTGFPVLWMHIVNFAGLSG